MSTNITSDNGVELEVCSLGIAVVNHEEETETWARLSDAQRVELAAALDPGRRGLHVRLDNQAKTLATFQRERDEALRKKDEAFDRAVRAERERDAAVARAEAVERERDELDDRLVQVDMELSRAVAIPPVSRADIDRALINVTSNAMNYPNPSQMLGKDSGPLRRKCVDAMCDLFGVEAEQAVDPVEAKVTTRHPEHYRLVNEADGSEWRMTRDGSWVAADSVGQEADQ